MSEVEIGTRCKMCGTSAPEALAHLCNRPECEYRPTATAPVEDDDWQCQHCKCRTFANLDVMQADGSFAPGPDKRCVNCKRIEAAPVEAGEVAIELLAKIEDMRGNRAAAFTLRKVGAVGSVLQNKVAIISAALTAARAEGKAEGARVGMEAAARVCDGYELVHYFAGVMASAIRKHANAIETGAHNNDQTTT
jgi:hypothetical protein